jgi:hypothetical protein
MSFGFPGTIKSWMFHSFPGTGLMARDPTLMLTPTELVAVLRERLARAIGAVRS